MANFIGLVFATLKNEGIDTSKMSTQEAIDKYNELKGNKSGTPAEQRKMKETTNKHIDKSVFDKAGEYFARNPERPKATVQAYKDTVEYINELANSGKDYEDIDFELTSKQTDLEFKRKQLIRKENKTPEDEAKIKAYRDEEEGINFASNQLWKAWKK